jgi:hypothetical protein
MRKTARLAQMLRTEEALIRRYRATHELDNPSKAHAIRTNTAASLKRLRRKLWTLRDQLDALSLAYRAMVIEQGLTPCDDPRCGCAASHVWERTAADMKRMTIKVKRAKIEPLAVAYRCSAHLPRFAPEWFSRYEPIQTAVTLPMAA